MTEEKIQKIEQGADPELFIMLIFLIMLIIFFGVIVCLF